jgi:hypothetical protein
MPLRDRHFALVGWLTMANACGVLFSIRIAASSSDQPLPFRRLIPQDGLPGVQANCVFEDSRGFLWSGSNDGLVRYDDRDMRIYRMDPKDPHSCATKAQGKGIDLGCTALAAATPEAALELATRQAGRIQLLITDVVMPGINGRELYKRLKAVQPELRCLYMSGHNADVIAHRGILEGACISYKNRSPSNHWRAECVWP